MSEHLYRKTPLMGWASWNAFRTNISEELMKKQMYTLVESGLAECGYIYANMDDGFYSEGGESENTLIFHTPIACYSMESRDKIFFYRSLSTYKKSQNPAILTLIFPQC